MSKRRKKINRIIIIIIAAAMVLGLVLGTAFSCAREADASELMEAIDYIVHVDGRHIKGEPVEIIGNPKIAENNNLDAETVDATQDDGTETADAAQDDGTETADAAQDDGTETVDAAQDDGTETVDTAQDDGIEIARTTDVNGHKELLLGIYSTTYDSIEQYVSLRDLAAVLNGTSRQFSFAADPAGGYTVTRGESYIPPQMATGLNGRIPMTDADGQLIYNEDWIPMDEDGWPLTNWRQKPMKDSNGQYVRNKFGQVLDTEGYPYVIGVQVPMLDANGQYVYDAEGQLLDLDGNPMTDPDTAPVRPDYEYLDIYVNDLFIDGQETWVYTYQLSATEDLYMSLMDAEMLFDITFEFEDDGSIHINPDAGCNIDLVALSEDGAFGYMNGIVLGDATTGEILFSDRGNYVEAIASTSKLMTYLIVQRNIELGRIKLTDKVTISKAVENLAYGGYGVIYLNEGDQIPVKELISAMLIGSSNESAMALAEYIAGSEEAFAGQMNEMAALLHMDSAKFYNASGLTYYAGDVYPTRHYNCCSAEDLFKLAAAVIRKYPEVTEYTSTRWLWLDVLDCSVSNTNYLLVTMPNLIGMKTGSTDEAKCCLVSALPVERLDGQHTMVAVVLGADDNIDRYQVSQMLLEYGKRYTPDSAAEPAE